MLEPAVAVGLEGEVCMFSWDGGTLDNLEFKTSTTRPMCLAFSPDGDSLAVGTDKATLVHWRPGGRPKTRLFKMRRHVLDLVFQDERILTSHYWGDRYHPPPPVMVTKRSSLRGEAELLGPERSTYVLAVAGNRLYASGPENLIRSWSLDSLEPGPSLPVRGSATRLGAPERAGLLLFCDAGDRPELRLLEGDTGREIGALGLPGRPLSLSLSASEERVLVGCQGGAVLATVKPLGIIQRFAPELSGGAMHVAFLTDEDFVVSGLGLDLYGHAGGRARVCRRVPALGAIRAVAASLRGA